MDPWYVELSDIVRRYVEERFALRAPELTTEEFLFEAGRSAELSSSHRGLLSDFLERCDRVKFARYTPGADESRQAFEVAERFLAESRAPEDPAGAAGVTVGALEFREPLMLLLVLAGRAGVPARPTRPGPGALLVARPAAGDRRRLARPLRLGSGPPAGARGRRLRARPRRAAHRRGLHPGPARGNRDHDGGRHLRLDERARSVDPGTRAHPPRGRAGRLRALRARRRRAAAARPNDTIGIVSFAAFADTAAPITLDHENLVAVVRNLEITTVREENQTAIGDALGLAVERLREAPVQSRVAVLLTDGVNNAGVESPRAAAELARTLGIKVHTIGAGTTGIAHNASRPARRIGAAAVRVRVEIDEATLRDIAARTGGRYFRAADAEALAEVYAEIDRLERAPIAEDRSRQYDEWFAWPLAAALALAAAGWLGRGTLFARAP